MRSTGSGESGSPGERLAALVERHRDVVAQLADLVGTGALTTIPVTALPPLVESLVRSLDRGTAVATAALGQLDASGDLIEGRYASTTRWLQAVARTSDGEAAAMLGRARDLRGDYTRVGDAWLAGDIPSGAVRELTTGVRRALTAIPSQTRDATRDDVLDTLLPVAGIDTVTDLRRLVKTLRFVLDPDGATQAALDAYDDQSLRVSHVGAMSRLTVWTTPEVAAAFLTVLDRQVNTWFADGALPADEQPHHGAPGPGRARRDHLLALAFGELVTGILDRGLTGNHHLAAPHLTLLVDLDRLQAGLGGDLTIPGHDDPAAPSRPATDTARSPTAASTSPAPTPTTSPNGCATTDRPTSTTSSCAAPATTTPCTKATGPSQRRPASAPAPPATGPSNHHHDHTDPERQQDPPHHPSSSGRAIS
jgi:hypothetical protein